MLLPIATVVAIVYMFAFQMFVSSGIDETIKAIWKWIRSIL
jgi:MFS superfamily sulfate permease-like transporter